MLAEPGRGSRPGGAAHVLVGVFHSLVLMATLGDVPVGHHPGVHVVGYVAVKQPLTCAAGTHGDRDHAAWQKPYDIGAPAVIQHRLPIPVNGVQVDFVA